MGPNDLPGEVCRAWEESGPPPGGAPSPSEAEFALFRKLFDQTIGLHLADHKRLLLQGRLGKRLRDLGLANFRQYYELLAHGGDSEEFQRAIDLITTHETSFFRESHHFQILSRDIANGGNPTRPLTVWSAACSTGEEPWSIAMVLHDCLGPTGWRLVASDVSQEVVTKASRGLYRMDRISGIPENYLKAYCLKGTKAWVGTMLIQSTLRSAVEFRTINLLSIPPDLSQLDVVFLRNVIIYFDPPTKRRILQEVAGRLKPGGWLFVGHSESLAGLDLPVVQIRPSVYRRVGDHLSSVQREPACQSRS